MLILALQTINFKSNFTFIYYDIFNFAHKLLHDLIINILILQKKIKCAVIFQYSALIIMI